MWFALAHPTCYGWCVKTHSTGLVLELWNAFGVQVVW